MRKIFCLLCSLALVISFLPLGCFAANSEKPKTVELYGNKISVDAKQICFAAGEKDGDFTESVLNSMYDPSFKKYYYVGDNTVDLKVVAKKLPKLQNLVVLHSDVKNVSALKNLDDLVYLGFHQCSGSGDLSFLKNLKGLKKFRYTSTYCDNVCESVDPVANLKNLTELYLDVTAFAAKDITPLKGLKKLKKLELRNIGGDDASIIKNFKNLKELNLRFTSERTDVSFLSSLQKLDSLELSGDTSNLGSTAKKYLKGLSKLSIDRNDEDMSFIGELPLDELSLSYVNSSFTGGLGNLAGLKSLALIDINDGRRYDMTFLNGLVSLETLCVFGGRGINLYGCKNVKNLSIMLCSFDDLSELRTYKKLETLNVYNNNDSFDIHWIEGLDIRSLSISDGSFCGIKHMAKLSTLKKLEQLDLNFTGISDETAKAIKKALPKCEIEVCELNKGYGSAYKTTKY
ncbi:MAG: hypothetical protein ACI4YB_12885 [Oscillospiraceae bacterium]